MSIPVLSRYHCRRNTRANMKIFLVFCLFFMCQECSGHSSCKFRFRLMSALETILKGQIATCKSQPQTMTTPAPTTPVTGAVRLVNGTTIREGTIQIYYNEMWGTICDDNFVPKSGLLACSISGYQSDHVLLYRNQDVYFGYGSGPIWLDQVHCLGNETALDECTNMDWGDNNCGHYEDVGVACLLNVRLVDGGSNPRQGRVEIEMDGGWGTVCDSQFDDVDAGVICNMLGYSRYGAQAVMAAGFGQGSGPIYFGDLDCTGNETSIDNCFGNQVGHTDCCHAMDAGVICQPVSIRLVNGAHSAEGRVEIYLLDQWGPICQYYFREKEAGVICAMLGFNRTGAEYVENNAFGEGTGLVLMGDVDCIGTEDSILKCSYNPIPYCYDDHVGVICQRD